MSPLASTLSKGVGSLVFKVSIVVVAALGGAGLVASNVFAALTATATNTSGGSVTTGTLKLQLAPSGVSGITAGFTSPISAMGPGDTFNRYIDLSNGQIDLRRRDRISDGTWRNWSAGIQFNLQLPAFSRAWVEVQKRNPTQFRELQRLVKGNFQFDPKDWRGPA